MLSEDFERAMVVVYTTESLNGIEYFESIANAKEWAKKTYLDSPFVLCTEVIYNDAIQYSFPSDL